LKSIYNKFTELNFPIEFFIDRLIPTLFADYLQTELFLRVLDVIIFEASLKGNKDDRVNLFLILVSLLESNLYHSHYTYEIE
jgi:hypothetical protein